MPHPESIRPDPLRPPTMDGITRARDMYREGFTVARCLAAGNMSYGTLYYWLDGGPTVAQAPARRRPRACCRRPGLAGGAAVAHARARGARH